MSTPIPGVKPDTPWLADQWVDGEQVSDLKLTRRHSEPLDDLAGYVEPYGSGLARVFATLTSGTWLSQDTIDGWTTIEDTAGWFDGTSINIPYFRGGLFAITAQLVSGVSGQAVSFILRGLDGHDAFWNLAAAAPSNGSTKSGASVHTVRRLITGGAISVQTMGTTFTPDSGFRCLFALTQLGYANH
jgi:hypothetical protein